MTETEPQTKIASRTHDLLGAGLGLLALFLMIVSPWQVDTSGPDPFYKGPLIFPLLSLALIVLGSLTSFKRLLSPPPGAAWRLDGHGVPWKAVRVLALLVLYLVALVLVGLEIATAAFLLAGLWMVGERAPLRLTCIPLGVTLLLYFFFKFVLDVWFPVPWLFERLGG